MILVDGTEVLSTNVNMPSRTRSKILTRNGVGLTHTVRHRASMEAQRRQLRETRVLRQVIRMASAPQCCEFIQPIQLCDFLDNHPLRTQRHAIYVFRTRFNGLENLVKFGLTNRRLEDRLGDHLDDPQFQESELIGIWYFPETGCPLLTRWVVIHLETEIKKCLREYRVLVNRPKQGGGQYTELVVAEQESNLLRTLRRLCRPGWMRELYHGALRRVTGNVRDPLVVT
jgi:hypothetical protein